MSKEYYIVDSHFWGNNSPNDKLNDISSMSYENGYDNCEKENQEYS